MEVTTIPAPAEVPAEAAKPPYTILDAVDDFRTGKRLETLMIVHNGTGRSFQVTGFNAKTGETIMKNSDGLVIKPRLSEREAKEYHPIWR